MANIVQFENKKLIEFKKKLGALIHAFIDCHLARMEEENNRAEALK